MEESTNGRQSAHCPPGSTSFNTASFDTSTFSAASCLFQLE